MTETSKCYMEILEDGLCVKKLVKQQENRKLSGASEYSLVT